MIPVTIENAALERLYAYYKIGKLFKRNEILSGDDPTHSVLLQGYHILYLRTVFPDIRIVNCDYDSIIHDSLAKHYYVKIKDSDMTIVAAWYATGKLMPFSEFLQAMK
jgi:hypothetical protein